MDLSAASQGALADIVAANASPDPASAPPAAPPAPDPAAPPSADPLAGQAPAAPAPAPAGDPEPVAADPANPTPAEQAAQDAWVLRRRGQTVEITDREEVRRLAEQGFDYTQKTQELAEQRRLFDQQMQEARAWLANPANLRRYLAQIEAATPASATPAAPEANPDDLISQTQAQQLIQAQLTQAQAQTQAYVAKALLEAETARYTHEYSGQVNQTLQTLLTEKFPLLKDVDKVEKLILEDVAEQVKARVELHPDQVVDIAEVKGLLVKAAQARNDRLQARIREHVKMETVRAAKLAQGGPEPPGAPPPAPAASPSFKLGDPRLTQSVIDELQAAFDRAGR